MKKWLVAIVCVLALCLAVCCCAAAEEDEINTFVTVTNGTLTDGVYTGSYYYRVNFSSMPDDTVIGMGFGAIGDDEPDENDVRIFPIGNLYGTPGHRYTFSFVDLSNPAWVDGDALFVRLDQREGWTKLAFRYDIDSTGAATTSVTNTVAPTLNNDNYTVTWNPVNGADGYFVHWQLANGADYSFFTPAGTTSMNMSDKALRDRYGEVLYELTKYPGDTQIWIETLKGGKSGAGTHKEFTIAGPANAENDTHLFLGCDREPVTADGKTYYPMRVYEDVWFTVMLDDYARHNIREIYFVNGNSTGWLNAWEICNKGYGETKWVPEEWYGDNSPSKDYTVYAMAWVADNENEGHWIYSDPMNVRVLMDQQYPGPIENYSVTGTPVGGYYEVPQDGSLIVNVTNQDGVDYYGCMIEECGAESHWITAEAGGTTEVRMPMFRTEVGKTYRARVYGVKIGAPIMKAVGYIDVKTTAKTGNQPIILQMKNQYETDERIRIYGYFENKQNLSEYDAFIYLTVREKSTGKEVFKMEGDGFYLWEDYLRINTPGTYVAEAVILQDENMTYNAQPVGGTWTQAEFSVIGGKGTMSNPTVALGTETAELGKAVSIAMSGSTCGNKAAERYVYRVFRDEDDPNDDEVLQESYANGEGTLYIDTGKLGNGRYRVDVEATAQGYEPGYTTKSFTVRAKPTVTITDYQPDANGVYTIPVHHDFTLRINANGADEVLVDLAEGWDREEIRLSDWKEWWNGQWGENHENIELTLQYDESCESQDMATFPVTVLSSYWFDGENGAPIASDSLTVNCTKVGQVDTSGWRPIKYWKTNAGGDVFLSWFKEENDNSWNNYTWGSSISIPRGNNLHIYLGTEEDDRSQETGWPEGCYECFSGFVMPAEQEGWNAYDANEPDESGWLRLNTAKFGSPDSTTINAKLILYTWKDGWDSNNVEIPLTVTNTQVTNGRAYWVLSGADKDWNLTITTHEGIYCSVYVPGANNVGLVMYDKQGNEIWNENWGQDMVCMRDFAIDKANELTMKAFAQFTADGPITEYDYPGKITVTSEGTLPAPTVAMKNGSHNIQKGQNAEFVVTENPALFDTNGKYLSQYANVHYNAFLWNENGDQIDQIWGIDPKSTGLSFNTDHLQAGCLYEVGVDIQQPGWDGADDKTFFALIAPIPEGQPTGTIQLSVDGSTGANISRPSCQQVHVEVSATGGATPTAVKVLNGDHWEHWYGKTSYQTDWYFGYDTTLVAMATYDKLPDGFDEDGWDWDQWDWDRDVQWTVASNTIYLKVTNQGDLPKPIYQLKKKTGNTWTNVSAENLSLVQGDELMIVYQISEMDFPAGFNLQTADYWGVAEIEQKRWDRWGAYWNGTDINWEYDKNTASILIPMYFYQPGDYRMRIGIDAVGWRDNVDQFEFRITEDENLPAARLSLEKASMMVGENIEIMAYAPGANDLKVEIEWDRDKNWNDGRGTGGDRGQWGWGCGCSGTYTFTLTASFNGGRTETDSQTLVVNRLSDSAVLSRPTLSGIPSVVPRGSGINGSFTAVSGAENYHVWLEYCPDDGNNESIVDENRKPSATGATALAFSAEQLSRPGQYKVSVSADKYGYDNGYNEQQFTVLPGSNTSQKPITLKVDGSVPASDPLEWPSSKQLKISVEAPDATAVRVLNGDRWEFWTSDDGFEGEWGFGDSVTLVAMATYDELPQDDWEWQNWNWDEDAAWTAVSNVINVNVTNKGDMPAPVYQLQYKDGNGVWQNTGADQTSFVRGTELRVVFASVEMPANFGADENYWGFVNVEEQKGDQYGNSWWDRSEYQWHWDEQNRCVVIQTVVYEPGNYRLDIGLDAEGWRGNSKEFEFRITPAESLPQATLTLDKTEMNVGDRLGICAYAPGADHMDLEITWVEDGQLNDFWGDRRWTGGDYGDWDWSCSVHGDYTFTLIVYYRDGGRTQLAKTLKVNASGQVGTINISGVNNQIWVSDSINGSFTYTPNENTPDPDRFTVRMEYRPDFGEGEEIYKENRNSGTAGWTTLAFGTELFSRPGEYFLQVSGEKYGYDQAYAEKHFVVLPEQEAGGLTLKINGSTANVENWDLWMSLEDVDVEVPANVHATAVRIWHGNYFEYFAGNRGYNDCDWGFDQGTLTFVAQATTDGKVNEWLNRYGDLDQFDWNSVAWGYTSNAINVTVVSKGTLADPTVKIDGNEWTTSSIVTVERGNPLQFTLTQNDENTNLSGLRILKYRTGGGLEDGSVMDTEVEYTGTVPVSIPTDIMSAGSYQMRIDPRRYGYYGNERTYDFTVTEPEDWQDQAKFTVSKTENVLTKEPVVFSINAPGAERVKLCYASEDNVWCEEECDDMLVSVQMNWVRDYDVYAYALYPDRNDWTEIGRKTIHVTAPNGSLEILRPTVPEGVKASENLNITLNCAFGESGGYFGCWLTDVNNKDYEFTSAEKKTLSGITSEQFSIPANTLQPGVYILSAYAFPNVTGWEMGHYSKTITVLAGDEAAPMIQLQLSTQQAETGDDVGIMAYAKGATHMQVEVIFPNDVPEDEWTYKKFEVDGDTLQESAFMGEVACTVTVRLTATYDGGNTNTLENTIQVNAPKGKLQPAIRLNRAWTAGTGLDFSVDLGVNDAQYVVKVWEQGANEPMFFDFQRGVREKEYYIRANQFRQGKTYEIEVICAGSGYGRGETNQMLRCRKASPMTMVLPGSLRTIEAEAFEGVIAEKIIVPDGVTSIGYKAFANCPRLMEIELPAGINIDAHAFDGCGAIVLYGKGGSYLSEYAETCNELFFAEVQ